MAHNGSLATDKISQRLAERIGHHTYDMWFGNTTRLQVEGCCVRVATDSRFVADWIDGHFRDELDGAAREALGDQAQVQLRVAPDLFGRVCDAESGIPPSAGHAAPLSTRKRCRASHPAGGLRRLEQFIVGASNRLAFAAAERIATGREAGSLLFIHGECGVGKTHLLQGTVQRARDVAAPAGAAARYLTAEQFTNEYVNAVRTRTLDRFRKGIRKLELLAIDDVHFLASKAATQRELQHTIDALGLADGRVVVASDEHPQRLGLGPNLASRFVAGMVARIERPDRETRIALVHALAEARGLRLGEAEAEAVATRCVGSVRELEGAMNKLAALSLLADDVGGRVGQVMIEQVFADGGWRPRSPLRIDTVIDTVCERLVVSRAELMGSGRHRRVVAARGLVAYLARELTTLSYPEIAAALGRRHHSTIHTAVGRVTRQLKERRCIEVGAGGRIQPLCELVDRVRHEILRSGRSA